MKSKNRIFILSGIILGIFIPIFLKQFKKNKLDLSELEQQNIPKIKLPEEVNLEENQTIEEEIVEAQPTEESEEHTPDDLKKIEGIGPKISTLLNEHQIMTYTDLAEKTIDELKEILDYAKIRIANPETWPEQAALAAKKDWEALENFQKVLKGGRKQS